MLLCFPSFCEDGWVGLLLLLFKRVTHILHSWIVIDGLYAIQIDCAWSISFLAVSNVMSDTDTERLSLLCLVLHFTQNVLGYLVLSQSLDTSIL